MKQKIFAIMGATGHIGHVVVEDLLKRGHIVRALGRDEKKLHELEIKGAIPVIVYADDADALTEAFTDAYAVFSLIPPGHTQENYRAFQAKVSQAICTAINNAGVTKVVNLSSVGANLAEGTGPIKGLHDHEMRLDILPNIKSLVHLRPDFFMENLNGFIPMIESQGVFGSPLRPDLLIAMCATRDIGWKAADFLDDTAPHPHLIFDFQGPKAVTMQHVAEVFQHLVEHPVRYVQTSYDDTKAWMLTHNMSPNVADLMIEMYQAFNTGRIMPTQEIKPTHQGSTSLDEYLRWALHRLYAHMWW